MKVHSMSIVVEDGRCNANCPYCVSKMTGFNFPEYREEREEAGDWPPEHTDELEWLTLEKSILFARQSGVSTILLTGKGEPTLQPRSIVTYLGRVANHFPFIELQTNGMLLLHEKYDKWLQRWYAEGLNTIAISVPHYDPEMCGLVMSGGRTTEYFDLPALVKKLKGIGYTVRINCVMFDKWQSLDRKAQCHTYQKPTSDKPDKMCGINTINEAQKFIKFVYEELGADQLTFTPLRKPEKTENEKVARWIKHHEFELPEDEAQGSFSMMVSRFFHNNAKLLLRLPHGAEIFDYNGHNVCISDCLTQNPDPERLRQLIFFPNGRLCYDWQYGGAVLLGGSEV